MALGIVWSSKSIQKPKQSVVGLKSLCLFAFRRLELGEGGLLELEMGMEIGLGRLDRLMAQPEGNYRAIDACLQQLHGGGVESKCGKDGCAVDNVLLPWLLSFASTAVEKPRTMPIRPPLDRGKDWQKYVRSA